MKTINYTNSPGILDTIELEPAAPPGWSVIWLHGLGADGNDFVPIVPQLVSDDWPAVRFVFPHAPMRAVTINNGARMRAWYDIRELDLANRADESGILESIDQVEALISREGERGIPASNVLLAGFSQGGAVTLAVGLKRTVPLAGMVVLSAYLPLGKSALDALAETTPDGARTQPLFMAHGEHDPVVPFVSGAASAKRMAALGFTPEWHAYRMAHQVCAEQINDLGAWMSRQFVKQAEAARTGP
ncbi:MAG: carboxylesterase [Lysobacter sp.]|nr:carboxylesterase [Lysobacter sp.]